MSDFSSTSLVLAGVFNFGIAVYHIFFWRLFGWKKDLLSLHKINRSIMHAMNFALIFIFSFFAYLLLFHAKELLNSQLGQATLTGVALFWLFRGLIQLPLFGYGQPRSLFFFGAFLIGAGLHAFPILVLF
ncbi:MAG TPA: hypothetical protein QGG18_05620 [Rhodospirillales bacterium]|nr:hypothetical protein [Rhodospirillales bacterium]